MSEHQPSDRAAPGGLVHAYLGYDPKVFPSPTAQPPDLAGAAFDFAMQFGDSREVTEEQLAAAIRIDPSQIAGLGPSLQSLIAMLEERKARILSTYQTETARREAAAAYLRQAGTIEVKKDQRDQFDRAVRAEQMRDLERLWYMQKNEHSPVSRGLMMLMERLGDKLQIEQLSGKYPFTGRGPLTVPEALEVKDELETIDRLLDQLREALKTARLAIIDMDDLSEFAQDDGRAAEMQNLNELQRQIEDYVRHEAQRQGLEKTRDGFRLTPRSMALVRGRLLAEIFSDLQAARSGRHDGPVIGEGAVETAKTKPYEFGDSLANMDVAGSFVNALVRARTTDAPPDSGADQSSGSFIFPDAEDLVVHRTRNTPRCATSVLMDMSGSMRHGGQYANVKRMALALDALIRQEYPGDHLTFIEMFTFAKLRGPAEIVSLLPKPVSIHNPVVRLRADMGDPNMSELRVPQHFTNIQHALSLARRVLSGQDTPNRQIALITDGLPTAHFEGAQLYLLYPPDPRTEEATMREAVACAREGITINIFLLSSWSQSSEDVAFARRLAETTRGRVFFTGGQDLDRFVLWDYVANRRRIIA
ncbi:MAG: VWA domain-containing protein [Phycisphaerales bacterium]